MELKQNPFSLYDFLGYFIPGAFLIYTVYFISGYISLDTPLAHTVKNINFEKPDVYLPFVIYSYVLGHVLSFVSAITIEQYAIWQFGYPSKFLLGMGPSGYFKNIKSAKIINVLIRLLVAATILPVTLLDIIFGQMFKMRLLYTKALDPLLIEVINNKVKSILVKHADADVTEICELPLEHDFFRYVDHFVLENAPYHVPKMHNYVALYGFLRTLTLIFVAFFWLLILHLFGFWHVFNSSWQNLNGVFLLGSTMLVTYVLFMAFVKFYRRYSLESLMAATVISLKSSNS